MQAAVDGTPYTQQYPIDAATPSTTKEIDASAFMEEDCTQCVEVGRTGCSVLGYHHTRIRTRLLCRFRLPHSVYQPLR